jgi:hypothetical protein
MPILDRFLFRIIEFPVILLRNLPICWGILHAEQLALQLPSRKGSFLRLTCRFQKETTRACRPRWGLRSWGPRSTASSSRQFWANKNCNCRSRRQSRRFASRGLSCMRRSCVAMCCKTKRLTLSTLWERQRELWRLKNSDFLEWRKVWAGRRERFVHKNISWECRLRRWCRKRW